MNLVSAKTGKVRSYAPRIGLGVDDAVVAGNSIWITVARDRQIVRLDARTGRPIGSPIKVPYPPGSVAYVDGSIWAGLIPGNEQPDQLVRIDPRTRQITANVSYPYGIMSITSSPSAIWIAARRRARIQRVDPDSGAPVKSIRVGNNRSEDVVYSRGALWVATPDDDAVYKVDTGDASVVPISVGKHPRQLAVTRDTVYVTNYNSSDLTVIDAKTSRVRGTPLQLAVNPFSLSVEGGTLWVGSPAENRLTKIATGRAG
jgi:YVTN family beta-propeller protein